MKYTKYRHMTSWPSTITKAIAANAKTIGDSSTSALIIRATHEAVERDREKRKQSE